MKLVGLGAFCCENYHRCIDASASQRLENVVPGHVGQHEIEHDERRFRRARLFDRSRAVSRNVDFVTCFFETLRETEREVFVILDDENL